MEAPATLVYIYGPPAVGKLTVATELQRLTNFRLFHNHQTVNAITSVFEFRTPPFNEVLHRLRFDVFETAARNGVDVIFTNSSLWGGPDGRRMFTTFAEEARVRVEAVGGRVVFVQLTAPAAVLEDRVGAESRREHKKLLDPMRLRASLTELDPAPLHHDDLVIDTSTITPQEAAALIATRQPS